MKNKTRPSLFTKCFRYITPLFQCPGVALRSFVVYSLWGITPVIHIVFIQKIVEKIESGVKDEFMYILLLYIGFNIVYEVLDFMMKKWGWVESVNTYRQAIDSEYIDKFIGLNNNVVEKHGTGKLVSIITTGSDLWALSLDSFMLEISKTIYIFIFSFYMIFQISVVYGFLFFLLYICLTMLGMYFNSLSVDSRKKRMLLWNEYIKTFVRILMNKVEIMQSAKKGSEIRGINSISEKRNEVNREMILWIHLFYRSTEAFVLWLKVGILFYLGLGVIDGAFSIAFFVGFFGIMSLMESAISQSMNFLRGFTKDFIKIEQLWDFFDTTPQIQGYEEGNTFQHKTGAISLKNVSYSYDENKPVFQDFSLDIAGQKVTALVGASGGGKSTLVKLISGYIRQDSGNILVDDQNLKETSLKSYYADVGYLTQEPSVFDGTVRENLMYAVTQDITHPRSFSLQEKEAGYQTPLSDSLQTPSSQFFSLGGEDEAANGQKNEAPFSSKGERIQDRGFFNDRLKKIITLANCEFIYDLPNGLDTEIGERGVKLSGGQKQRLAIAKIFLKDPKIIILDEPTSALDSLSEQKITQAMHNLFENRTVLVIAHRLQTVKHADDIVVIEGGEVRERGTHESLVKQDGFYKQMLDLQSGF